MARPSMPTLLALTVALLVGAAGCDLVGCDEEASTPAASAAAPKQAEQRLSPAELHDCRDTCEQNALLMHLPDQALRDCRRGCDERGGTGPHEVPSRITVAPTRPAAPRAYGTRSITLPTR